MLMTEFIQPLSRRVGTALAAYLVTSGVDASLAEQLVNSGLAAFFIIADLARSHYARVSR